MEEAPTQSFDRTQARILIVDDQETNRMILERRLRMDHYEEITQAADGKEALALLETNTYDVILLDMIMPEIGGYEVLCSVKKDPNLRHIPIIMISADDDISKIVQCIQEGAEDYLGKPFNPTLLRARLSASLDKKILRDKEKAYQEQIASQQKMASLGALTEGVAHELKNPIHFIVNFADLSEKLAQEIAKQVATDAPELSKAADVLRTNIEKITEHGKRADAILRVMLDHSRTTGGKFQKGDINKLLGECLAMVFAAHKSKYTIFDVSIKKEFTENLERIDLIWQDIVHVVMNVIDNALYATCAKAEELAKTGKKSTGFVPQVIIASAEQNEMVEITVKDNGLGISEENLEKIFEPFFTTKPIGDGTGLGLSLVSGIIADGHGGQYSIESTEGVGTLFRIRLPKQHAQ
ncbi:MAG: response regulator [Holosporales bacterium]|nr:response regulator [Holosporales bacterium]